MLPLKPDLKTFFIRYNPWQAFWMLLWNISEYLNISLPKAPWVFAQMMGYKTVKVLPNALPSAKEKKEGDYE